VKHPDLFGGETELIERKPRGWEEVKKDRGYQKSDDKDRRCKNCVHLVVKRFSKTYYKCNLMSVLSSPSSDIRVGHVCKLFEPN